MAIWTQAQADEGIRKALTPWELSLGSPVATTGISWSAGVDNKLIVTVAPSVLPNGFDMYTTPQGAAIRFIGSGLGNGDSSNFSINTSFSLTIGSGQGIIEFKAVTRPYTEIDFANVVPLNYVGGLRNFSNNDAGSVSLTPQIVTLNDGDLIEFTANPVNNLSNITMDWSGILVREA